MDKIDKNKIKNKSYSKFQLMKKNKLVKNLFAIDSIANTSTCLYSSNEENEGLDEKNECGVILQVCTRIQ